MRSFEHEGTRFRNELNRDSGDPVADASQKEELMSDDRSAAASTFHKDETINNADNTSVGERPFNRRQLLCGSLGAAAVAGLTGTRLSAAVPENAVVNGRIKQSVVFWCFNVAGDKWSLDRTCEITTKLGGKSVEIVGPEDPG